MSSPQQVQTAQHAMQQAAQIFGDTTGNFTNELQRVNSMMASLQAGWTGTASKQFNLGMDDWETAFDAIIKQLIHMMEVMGVNTKDYITAEEDATNTAKSFMTALPGF